jgi:hypothetical protein
MFHKVKPYHQKDCLLILGLIQKIYRIECEAKDVGLDPTAKVALRRQAYLSFPVAFPRGRST